MEEKPGYLLLSWVGKKCPKAGEQLGFADPEDSDLNTIFGAIKIYDELKSKEKVEIAIVSGDENVRVVSDNKIADQINYLKKSPET